MKTKKQVEKTLDKLSRKLIRYAEILAKGTVTCYAAGLEAGFKQTVARARAPEWIGRTREASKYPNLFDYYDKLRKDHLREFDVKAETVLKELALIAFSDITRFVDLPSAEYERKKARAYLIDQAVYTIEDYKSWQNEQAANQDPNKVGPKFKRDEPKQPTYKQLEIVAEFMELSDEERSEVMVWKHYSPGSIRLRNIEEIPKSLLPAIAEISNTREGIKIKLHDKMAALDKLARHLGLYDVEGEEDGKKKVSQIKAVQFVVNGSKSDLLNQELGRHELGATG